MKTIFTTGQVAKICKVAPRTVSKWFDSGRLRGYRIPGSQDRRIPREHLIRFLKEHGMPLGELEDEAVGKILIVGAETTIRNGLKGWFNIYRGNEDYWSAVLWKYLGPTYLALLVFAALVLLARRSQRSPNAYAWIWFVLVIQNVIAQLITGPLTQWREAAFSIYYLLLLAISAVIVMHYQRLPNIVRHRDEA